MHPSEALGAKFRDGARAAAMYFLYRIPGNIGRRIRGSLMRPFFKSLGEHTVLQPRMLISCPQNIAIGSHCNIALRTSIIGDGGVTIGNWVGFGPDVKVWSINHRFEDPDIPWMLQGVELKPVVIEDDVCSSPRGSRSAEAQSCPRPLS
jgi:acetyltransferase-like isoleucine patch superfamily enzyme